MVKQTSAGSLAALRRHNRRVVLAALQGHRADTRIDLARVTGLSRTTVSSLVADLIAESVVVEVASATGEPRPGAGHGRPPIKLALHPEVAAVVGVHLRHDGVRVVLADLNGTVLGEDHQDSDVDHHPTRSLEHVARTVRRLVGAAHVDPARIDAVGVAVAAPVHLGGTGVRTGPLVMQDWSGVDIAEVLGGLTGLPVHVGNDANLGALAESTWGAGRGVDDLVYVMLSDGVGAGLVLRGQLYEGASGAAGPLGHVAVVPDGHIFRCGTRGCLETVSGSRALLDALSHSRGPETTLTDLLTLVADGDPGATRAITDAGRAVGQALAGIIPVLDPRLVVIGGRVASAGVPLLNGVRDVLSSNLAPSTNDTVRVVASELGDRAEVLGAIAVASESVSPELLVAH